MTTAISIRLTDCCDLQTGFTARKALEPDPDGVRVVQLSDFDPNAGIDPDRLMHAQMKELAPRYLVEEGDVLFRSRGELTTATVLGSDFGAPAVALSPLYVLRPDPQRVMASYLAWALNLPDTQRRLASGARGTKIRMVPLAELGALEIDLPSLAVQKHITEIDRLSRREQQLSRQLADHRHTLTQLVLAQRAKGIAAAGTIERSSR